MPGSIRTKLTTRNKPIRRFPHAMQDLRLSLLLAISLLALPYPTQLFAQHISDSGIAAPKHWKMETVVEGLRHPWGLEFLPDERILVTERTGQLRLIKNGELQDSPITGTPEVFAAGQGGLLDLAIDPDFNENQLIYLTYSSGNQSSNQTTLGRGKLEGMELRNFEVLLKAEPSKPGAAHFGSRILFLPDKTMLVSIGDGGNPPVEIGGMLAREQAQNLGSHPGSILRLNRDGTVPEDNPFVHKTDARPEIYSYGHRNIQGLAFDPETQTIWANEHGPLGGDEINRIIAGENYGWPLATYGRDYRSGKRFTPHKTLAGMRPPVLVWSTTRAPSGLTFYTGNRFPEWKGSLFSGSLRGQRIDRIVLDGEEVRYEESLPVGERIRLVTQGPDEYLYLLTDSSNGKLLKLSYEG